MVFDDAIEATRLGTVFASNIKALNRWRSRQRTSQKRPAMSDAQLEAAILRIGERFPGNVERVTA